MSCVFRWTQLPLTGTEGSGRDAGDQNGTIILDLQTNIEMVELHVDSHPSFHEQMNENTFGGNLSVRMPPNTKPLICFGQDECIFKQFLFTGKAWTAPDGQNL
jgi:hypothetical protein